MKEKMKKIQYVSIGLAIAGVLYMTINYGQFPWISILLALSFAFYGLLKKLLDLDSMNSLFVEVLFILPFMLFLLFQSDINNIISSTTFDIVLMLFAGVVTIIPLVLFAEGVKRIPLSVVGFLQYIAPTLMLLLGVIRYGEEFTMAHGVSFSLIWAGLILFSISSLRTESIETQ
jgi:chloramphenicol-sensitive protein RarD